MDNNNTLMRQLVDELNRASDAYYNGRGERMTDYEWDAKFDQLRQLEQETGTVLPDSPTHNVSADSTAGQKEAHEFPALSLAKTKSVGDLAKWADGRPIWISWKLDGLTLVVTYDGGRLTKVVTRGDGHIGTNITHLARAIDGIPPRIKAGGHVVVRGEAVISYADFERFNLESDEEYANPRNLASGSLTLKDPAEVAQRHIHWIPFTLVAVEKERRESGDAREMQDTQESNLSPLSSPLSIPKSWGARMDWLKAAGLGCVEHELIEHPTVDNINNVVARWTEKVTKRENPYPVDGLVITYDDTDYAATGSVTGHHATRAGYAFKWADESALTELDHIEWSCAASTISPVAVFKPVELEGTTVKRASLCNISECERLGIGGKGTEMEVIKANKIIPKVIKIREAKGSLEIPDHCPVCGSPTEITVSPASGTKALHCTNPHCPAKQLKKFARFVSKQGMNIDGISEQTLQKFVNLGWIKDFADIYHLPEHEAEIARLDGFKEKSAHNIATAVEKARTVEARRLLYALCIPLCGQDVCNRLLSAYTLEELVGMVAPSLSLIPGIGPEKAGAFVSWFKDPDNHAVFDKLMKEVTVETSNLKPQSSKLSGLTFVITGDVHHYKNRTELKAYIESQGGKVTGSVSKATSYLINNDTASTSGKNQKAHQLGTPIISEDDFIEKFG